MASPLSLLGSYSQLVGLGGFKLLGTEGWALARSASSRTFALPSEEIEGETMQLQSVTLYQPEHVIGARVSVGDLSAFIQQLLAALAAQSWGGPPTSRALVVALSPSRHEFWVIRTDGTADEEALVRSALATVQRPRVVGGPVAFAMLLDLGQQYPSDAGPPVPAAWSDLARAAGHPLNVDELLDRLLA